MVLKTPFKKSQLESGFTLLEITIAFAIMALLFSALLVFFNPGVYQKRARDQKRISDLSLLERVVSEYYVDYGSYPDLADTLRSSTVLPSGSINVSNSNTGWILQDVSKYTSHLPLDPLNDATYFYRYQHNGASFEFDAKLEYEIDVMTSDGGDDDTYYEVGNDLSIL